jgi:hypothetical protein
MQTIFISTHAVLRPDYYTKFYERNGTTFLRPESYLHPELFTRFPDAVRVELYKNSTSNKVKPTLIGSITQ